MIKTLTQHGNSAALIIDKAILELLNITWDTPLEIITDGKSLIISPVRDKRRSEIVRRALAKVNMRHFGTLSKLGN
ncbi:MAG: AbrB/MazE/SpoVT family DNA-binding domain-containing protein [Chloroflexi bacterium]|nr:AbrB/MazE/SpoVT family DNA-binding domain-containing protein [Chloroflexota bacterium]